MAKLSYSQAIRETIAQEMRRDERVFVMGEDVEKLGGVYGCTRDLYKEFGTDRVRNTPISESAIIGAALGAASGGMRPIAELMYWDFGLPLHSRRRRRAAAHRHPGRQPRLLLRAQGALRYQG